MFAFVLLGTINLAYEGLRADYEFLRYVCNHWARLYDGS